MQPLALLGAHRAVVEVKVQVADSRTLLVADLTVGVTGRQPCVWVHRELRDVALAAREGECARGGQLEGTFSWCVATLEVGDPDRTVDGRSADRAGALRDDFACAPTRCPLVVDAEEMKLRAPEHVEHPGVALGGADLA